MESPPGSSLLLSVIVLIGEDVDKTFSSTIIKEESIQAI